MQCPVCHLPEDVLRFSGSGDRLRIECPRCGPYMISRTVMDILRPRSPSFALSAWIRAQEGASEVPWLLSSELEQIEQNLPRYSVSEKQLVLLRVIEKRTQFAGAKVQIAMPYDFTLAWLASVEELQYIMRALMARDLLAIEKYSDPKDSFSHEATITPRGWDYLDEHAKPAQIANQAFVAMAFADELRPAWTDGLAPGLTAAGFHPYRVDVEPHLDRIDAKIVAEIKNSRFLVADVTLQRPGVYFEAGFAIGLGLPVFWSVREDELANVHFDTRQYNHIVWKSPKHLRDQLTPFVVAIVGRGAAA
jgi:nucleoside 2-deoxyribosyltransferase